MKNYMLFRQHFVIGAVLSALCLFGTTSLQAGDRTLPKPSFNAEGELIRPDFRFREWVHVGTPLTPNDLNPPEAPFPEFHNVYIHPDDFDHWKNTGTFPDGTVIAKELVLVGSKQAVSGTGYFMGEFAGLEITIKDAKRFPNEPGNWAYFSFGHSYPLADSAKPFPTEACNVCHETSAADDFVFTQYYPVLRATKASRSGNVMTSETGDFKKLVTAMTNATGNAFKPTADTPRVDSAVPTNPSALFKYLQQGAYKNLAAKESAMHPSAGPHTKAGLPVRVFVDAKMEASLKAENDSHPVGAGIVKEMYDAERNLQGWAVMVKTAEDSAGGKGWFWYEITSTTDESNPVAVGNGVPLCFGCHTAGTDYVLTGFPLK